jgi:oligosaccharyltransferase complex subunit alpha (ribophorin I)
VLFADAALRAVSPYTVEAQTIEALTPSGVKPLSFFPNEGVLRSSSSGGIVKFSPSGSTKPWGALDAKVRAEDGGKSGGEDDASPALSVHFPLDEPLVRGLRVVREVEVSHWGNVYFEESYLIRNDGPAVEGEFSRRRYSDRSAFLGHMFENLRARLPANSRWIYFRDAIGNVSTSAVHRLPKGVSLGSGEKNGKRGGAAAGEGGVVVDLGMRYPMLGGWEVDFVLGYSLPLSAVVSRVSGSGAGGRMRLRIPLPAPIEGMYADELEVRVVLPEGAKKIAHAAPSAPNAQSSLERKSTYLDAPWGPGRPVLALKVPNAVPDHASARLTVEYSIGALDLLRKPLVLVAAYGAVFGALALFNRADFSIVPASGGGKAAAKVKAA